MTRTDKAVEWVIWHALELAAVGVPLALAVWLSVWFAPLAVVAGVAWALNERRTRATALTAQRRQVGPGAGERDPGRVRQTGQHTGAGSGARNGNGKEASA